MTLVSGKRIFTHTTTWLTFMAKKSRETENFWQELKRRKVLRVTTVYAAAAFVILQLVDIIAQPLQLPEWTLALIIVLLGIGLIITIIVSWIYDITPSGVRKTNPASTAKPSNQTTAPTSSGWKIATYISAVIILALIAFNFVSKRNLNADVRLEKSIAVLPFRNDSPDTTNTYFINGLMEEVLNNLMKISDFRILSRTSTEQYQGTNRPTITEIARKLGVNYIIEGSGQKYANKFRLRIQLIKAKGKESHLWANSYEQELRETSDFFAIQSQIAKAITQELKTTITPEEKKLIEKVPTGNMAAYDLYLRANEYEKEYWKTLDSTSYHKAATLYKTIIELDSTFAKAYTGLARANYNRYYKETYLKENFLDSCLILATKALSLDNNLDEAYFMIS